MNLYRLIDYHTHTKGTVDSNSTVDACCKRASELGLAEIGFTNHVILGNPDYCMSLEDMQEHVYQIQDCRQRYPNLAIRLGVEVDYFEGKEAEIAALLHRYEETAGCSFDYVMGAVHYLKGIFFSSKVNAPDLFLTQDKGKPLGEELLISLYNNYFDLVSKAIRSGLFDFMAHLDLIKKYANDLVPRISFDHYRESAENTIQELLNARVGIEINTKGLSMRVGETYPSDELLDLYVSGAKKLGIEPIITIGADSHQANKVGTSIREGVLALQRAGVTQITGFQRRKPYPIPIPTFADEEQ